MLMNVLVLFRYMYAEGMKLAKRYEQEEKELSDKLTVSHITSYRTPPAGLGPSHF